MDQGTPESQKYLTSSVDLGTPDWQRQKASTINNSLSEDKVSTFTLEKISLILSQAKLMQMMTQSQLDCVALDCKKLAPVAQIIKEQSFKEFINNFVQLFEIKL